ncbi:autoinducer binding domain-containing protein [Mesorhizobium sp. M0482]|uniref:autoinducer binding domain-containing protein n=1 Tax=Mesorhizobium sp. M0482 TaxID=2956948 RepID=UPI00333B45DE
MATELSRKRTGAFRWSEVYNDTSTAEDQRRVFDEAATFGLRSGVSVPFHGPDGSFAIISFAQSCDCEFQNRTVTYLQLAAFNVHLKITKLANSTGSEEAPHLPREKRVCPVDGKREIVMGDRKHIRGRCENRLAGVSSEAGL